MLKEDYLTRSIKDMVRAIAKLVLNKDMVEYTLPELSRYTQTDLLYERLIELADQGLVNDAENYLSDRLDRSDIDEFEMALCFYLHVNEFGDDFLESHDYSREEINDGIQALAQMYGYTYDIDFIIS